MPNICSKYQNCQINTNWAGAEEPMYNYIIKVKTFIFSLEIETGARALYNMAFIILLQNGSNYMYT